MTRRFVNPKEMICMLLYEKPRNSEYICKILYGKRNSKVFIWIYELRKDGLIKKIPYIDDDMRKGDYQTTSKWLTDKIEQSIKVYNQKLTNNEKKKLNHYFSEKSFREWVGGLLIDPTNKPWQNQHWFNKIRDILCLEATKYYYFHKLNLFEIHLEMFPAPAYRKKIQECFSDFSLCYKLSALNVEMSGSLMVGMAQLEQIYNYITYHRKRDIKKKSNIIES